MIEILEAILPYIRGLWTLPWIVVGFFITILLSRILGEEKINKIMKKIGLILLYFFVPFLLFRIFLSVDFGENEIAFSSLCFVILALMYILAYYYAKKLSNKFKSDDDKRHYIKTILTNQGRSSAFVGGALLAIQEWWVLAAIYMSIGAIFLFAIIPYILSYLHKKDFINIDVKSNVKTLPWYLRLFPWYLLLFAFSAVILHRFTGLVVNDFGDFGIAFIFFTSLTIPAALYYVGAGIHPRDLKINEMKKLFDFKLKKERIDHWFCVRNIFFLTVIITPILTIIFTGFALILDFIPKEWFAVLVINSILPITSTNMFLVPYGIDKKITALSVTWTTLVCIPIVMILIVVFRLFL